MRSAPGVFDLVQEHRVAVYCFAYVTHLHQP